MSLPSIQPCIPCTSQPKVAHPWMFSDGGGTVQRIGQQDVGPDAHSIAVDPDTHHLYVPPQNLNGQPVLRGFAPAGT